MRNYKKEAEWAKQKYVRLGAYIEPTLANEFKAKLKEDNIPFAQWLTKAIKEYLEKAE